MASEGKFLLEWYDMDTTDYKFEGTWDEMQRFICDNLAWLQAGGCPVLSNSRDELLRLSLW